MASPAFFTWLELGAFVVVFALAHLALVIRVVLTWPARLVRTALEEPLFRLLDKLS